MLRCVKFSCTLCIVLRQGVSAHFFLLIKGKIMNQYYTEGKQAHGTGKRLFDNPYARDTEEYKSWQEGWKSASQKAFLNS